MQSNNIKEREVIIKKSISIISKYISHLYETIITENTVNLLLSPYDIAGGSHLLHITSNNLQNKTPCRFKIISLYSQLPLCSKSATTIILVLSEDIPSIEDILMEINRITEYGAKVIIIADNYRINKANTYNTKIILKHAYKYDFFIEKISVIENYLINNKNSKIGKIITATIKLLYEMHIITPAIIAIHMVKKQYTITNNPNLSTFKKLNQTST